jgi:RNA polymerase sigma-70 factor (ECF subfamily)
MMTIPLPLPAFFQALALLLDRGVVPCVSGEGPRSRTLPAEVQERDRVQERDWVRAAQGGDPEAFRRLVDRYQDRAYEIALRVVRSAPEAEEAAQDGFLRAWRALPSFREESAFSTWLYRIVTRRAIDLAGKAKRRAERETVLEPGALEDLAQEVEPTMQRSERQKLHRILGGLDATPRAVVTLFYLRDCPVADVAGILDLPEGTVKTHLHRARAALRDAWRRESARERNDELPRL